MGACQSCGGIIGRDCFNPEECAWITQQQANSATILDRDYAQIKDELYNIALKYHKNEITKKELLEALYNISGYMQQVELSEPLPF